MTLIVLIVYNSINGGVNGGVNGGINGGKKKKKRRRKKTRRKKKKARRKKKGSVSISAPNLATLIIDPIVIQESILLFTIKDMTDCNKSFVFDVDQKMNTYKYFSNELINNLEKKIGSKKFSGIIINSKDLDGFFDPDYSNDPDDKNYNLSKLTDINKFANFCKSHIAINGIIAINGPYKNNKTINNGPYKNKIQSISINNDFYYNFNYNLIKRLEELNMNKLGTVGNISKNETHRYFTLLSQTTIDEFKTIGIDLNNFDVNDINIFPSNNRYIYNNNKIISIISDIFSK